jgi:hypothetical protein
LTFGLIFENLRIATDLEILSFVLDSTARHWRAFLFLGSGFPSRTVGTRRESIRARRKCPSKLKGVQGLPRQTARIRGAPLVVSLPEIEGGKASTRFDQSAGREYQNNPMGE